MSITIAVHPNVRSYDAGGEDIEVTNDGEWDLQTALDMCHRIDRMYRTRGRALAGPDEGLPE